MNAVKELVKLLKEANNKPAPYDTEAKVTRVDGDTVWVHIAGGVDETPIERTIDAKSGDVVRVRMSNGRAWIAGNGTSPPTDDTTAIKAHKVGKAADEKAVEAQEMATEAGEDAVRAHDAADAAQTSADSAAESAGVAAAQAVAATNSASQASDAANAATYNLSEVERVIDVLGWISEHATYKATDDTAIVPGKWYFKKVGNSYVQSAPNSNPKTEGLYELDEIDTAVSNYISTHMWLDDSGLYIRMDSDSGAMLRLTGTGIYLIANGKTVAQYTGSIVLGDPDGPHIELSPTYGLGFYQSTKIEEAGVPVNRVAYIQENQLNIENAILRSSLQIGDFKWVVMEHRISLKYNKQQ